MVKVTLDVNCLINLKNMTCQWKAVQQIIKLHKQGKVIVCVSAISASEYQIGKKPKYKDFTDFLASIYCGDLFEIYPMIYSNVTYFDHCYFTDTDNVEFERKIHNILFPKIEFEYDEYCKVRGIKFSEEDIDKKWLNAKCDVQILWSHINVGNDIFITEDTNFLKSKKTALIKLGSKKIITPIQFVQEIIN